MKSKAAKIAAVALLTALLAGCYLPIKFDAEVEITRNGYYSVIFDGYLVSIPLTLGLRDGTISPLEENEKVGNTLKDFKRDSAVKEAKYFKQGRFKVNWQKKGRSVARPHGHLPEAQRTHPYCQIRQGNRPDYGPDQSHRQIDRPTTAQ